MGLRFIVSVQKPVAETSQGIYGQLSVRVGALNYKHRIS
jgi:hypothetical protein